MRLQCSKKLSSPAAAWLPFQLVAFIQNNTGDVGVSQNQGYLFGSPYNKEAYWVYIGVPPFWETAVSCGPEEKNPGNSPAHEHVVAPTTGQPGLEFGFITLGFSA